MNRPARGEGVVILGAGLAGLSAAYHLGPRSRVFEAQARPGGVCATDRVGGYAFDQAGHLLHVRTQEMKTLVHKLLPKAFNTIARDARIHLFNAEVRYPIQGNLFGLPANLKAGILHSFLEAACAKPGQPKNFSAWASAHFGKKLSEVFFEPYNRKLWTVDPKKLTLEWMGRFVPRPELERVITGAFKDMPEGGGYNASFWYPKQGGIECLARSLARHVPGLQLQARAVQVNLSQRTVTIAGQGEVPWKQLVSTLPLPALVAMLVHPPARIQAAARALQSNNVWVVNLGIKRALVHPAHWLYFPEEKYSFYRVGFPGNFGTVAPRGRSALYAEVAFSSQSGPIRQQELVARVRRDLQLAGILRPDDEIETVHVQYLPHAYVIYDAAYAAARKSILTYLKANGVQCIGRWGSWEYSAMEDALLAGYRLARGR